MRQMVIIKESDTENFSVINLSKNLVSLEFFMIGNNGETVTADINTTYQNCILNTRVVFDDIEEVREFKDVFTQYLMNGTLPVEVEGKTHEVRYWMEFYVKNVTQRITKWRSY